MRTFIRVLALLIGNVIVYVGLVMWYARWIAHEVQEEFRLGIRVSSDDDSISIPIAGFALFLAAVLLAANAVWWICQWWRRRSRVVA